MNLLISLLSIEYCLLSYLCFFEHFASGSCLRNTLTARQINQVKFTILLRPITVLASVLNNQDRVTARTSVVLICRGHCSSALADHKHFEYILWASGIDRIRIKNCHRSVLLLSQL